MDIFNNRIYQIPEIRHLILEYVLPHRIRLIRYKRYTKKYKKKYMKNVKLIKQLKHEYKSSQKYDNNNIKYPYFYQHYFHNTNTCYSKSFEKRNFKVKKYPHTKIFKKIKHKLELYNYNLDVIFKFLFNVYHFEIMIKEKLDLQKTKKIYDNYTFYDYYFNKKDIDYYDKVNNKIYSYYSKKYFFIPDNLCKY